MRPRRNQAGLCEFISHREAVLNGLKPGDADYRAYVGEVQNYDRLAALQFGLVTLLGLREQHHLLDVGCGSLRGGRLFIPYLGRQRYFGLEPNKWLVQQGIESEIGEDLIDLKRPAFAYNDDFDLGVFGGTFDYILAQSIFSHAGKSQIDVCLQSVQRVLKPSGLLVATFVERAQDLYEDHWVYPGLNQFSWKTIKNLSESNGLVCRKVDWPHPLQTWFVVAHKPEIISAALAHGVDALADETILTPRKFAAKKSGKTFNFLRHA